VINDYMLMANGSMNKSANSMHYVHILPSALSQYAAASSRPSAHWQMWTARNNILIVLGG
jgi:hypothetical protein